MVEVLELKHAKLFPMLYDEEPKGVALLSD